MLVLTRPMLALAAAPRLPTMLASIYCIMMCTSCAIMLGKLSKAVSLTCDIASSLPPSRMNESNWSLLCVYFISG